MAAGPIAHDKDVFQLLFTHAHRLDPTARAGSMFGCPAVFHGRRMSACVYGDSVGLRVPEEIASNSLRAGRATAFRPYGRPAMREWVQIDGGACAVAAGQDLLAAAVTFAGANNG
jgi:hypothetical protein